MATITITARHAFRVPINGECISPDNFVSKKIDEVSQLQLWEGNRRRALSELFTLDAEDIGDELATTSIHLVGDLDKVRRVGARMTGGEVLVEGNIGMHLGEEMKGGKITVIGEAGSWTGSSMKGGTIRVKGNTGDYLAAPYRGLSEGMKGGSITVEGDTGSEAGCYMVGGLIRVRGTAGLYAGIHMKGGVFFIEGDAGERVGAEMTGGRIAVLGKARSVLPGFVVDGVRNNTRVGEERVTGPFYAFKGDVTEGWNGTLLLSVKNNPELKVYESRIG
ncbi:formylmethanofuran dehydrogenase subunit C [Candidatus Bathyarchaeota archaeon]|nr:formylmethanofuran dehydrogenase subunit C [Candidatus Bathyarchaeota archaeon]